MKKQVFVLAMAAFFICSTFAGASVITKDIKNETVVKNDEPSPCPAVAIPPGLWNTGYENGGKISLLHGQYKKVDKDESITVKSEMCFFTFGGVVIGIPSTADMIKITLKERKDGGSWVTICEDSISQDESNSNGKYNHRYSRSYSEDGIYEIEVSATSYKDEKSWGSGGGRLYTLTTIVGNAESKSVILSKILDTPIFDFLNNFFDLERFL